MTLKLDQSSETRPRVGNMSQKLPPPSQTINPMPSTNPGIEYPINTIVLDIMSNLLPSLTAFFMPNGMLTK